MLWIALAKTVFILVVVLGVLTPLTTWIERKQSALMQDRIGIDRTAVAGASLHGLLQPMADLLKLLFKEDVVPTGANRLMHLLAPMVAVVAAISAFAVIPYGGRYEFGDARLSLVVADIDWGVLWVLALASLAALATVLAGWASNNNWSLIGGVRGAAQMVSYEVGMGLALVPLIMVYGTLRLSEMGLAQDQTLSPAGLLETLGLGGPGSWLASLGAALSGLLPAKVFGPLASAVQQFSIPAWGLVLNPPAFVMFLTCAMAANRRPPFDLSESSSELVAGSLTEYSGMRFGFFYLAEFIQVIVIAGLVVSIFLGGWTIPWISQPEIIGTVRPLLGEGVASFSCLVLHTLSFFGKLLGVIWLQMLIRWSLPRFRYDQLMDLCWKVILPASLLNIFATAAVILALGDRL